MTKEQNTPHPRPSLLAKTLGPIESRPNMSMAAKTGTPQMAPPEEDASLETLVGSNGFNLNASGAGANSSTGAGATGGSGRARFRTPPAADGSTSGTGAAVEIVTPGSTPTRPPLPRPLALRHRPARQQLERQHPQTARRAPAQQPHRPHHRPRSHRIARRKPAPPPARQIPLRILALRLPLPAALSQTALSSPRKLNHSATVPANKQHQRRRRNSPGKFLYVSKPLLFAL